MVIFGSARIDENGTAHGGKPGDQTSKEVSAQNWYKHAKGWRVFRARNAERAARIAAEMRKACDNPNIGYDQWNRNTLFSEAEKVGFDLSKVSTPCETDCSALVRVCLAATGILLPSWMNTKTLPGLLNSSGAFEELKGSEYTDKPDKLKSGDILCTSVQGHVVVVIQGNDSEGGETVPTIRKGSEGLAVRIAQRLLNAHGSTLELDGEFGPATLLSVKAFQQSVGIKADGIIGPKTWEKLSI